MHTSTDAKTCLRRRQCQPVGGYSVWGSVGTVDTSKDIVMAVAQMDSDALFHDLASGSSGASGIAVVVSALSAINNHVNGTKLPKQILGAIFNSEAYGYGGSMRFLDDVTSFNCLVKARNGCQKPFKVSLKFQQLTMARLDSIVEVGHMDMVQNDTLYLHSEKSANSATASLKVKIIQAQYGNITIAHADQSTPGLPPGPAQSFYRAKKEAGIVTIAQYSSVFTTRHYHSQYDHADTTAPLWKQSSGSWGPLQDSSSVYDSLCVGVKVLSKGLWVAAGGDQSTELLIDCALARQIYTCLTTNSSCELAQRYGLYSGRRIPTRVPSRYASVMNFGETYTPWLINYLMNDVLKSSVGAACSPKKPCKAPKMCVGGVCVDPNAYLHDGWSTGLSFNYANNWFEVTDPTKPVWVEANWGNDYGVRIFVEDTLAMQLTALFVGLAVIPISIIIVRSIKRMHAKYHKHD